MSGVVLDEGQASYCAWALRVAAAVLEKEGRAAAAFRAEEFAARLAQLAWRVEAGSPVVTYSSEFSP